MSESDHLGLRFAIYIPYDAFEALALPKTPQGELTAPNPSVTLRPREVSLPNISSNLRPYHKQYTSILLH